MNFLLRWTLGPVAVAATLALFAFAGLFALLAVAFSEGCVQLSKVVAWCDL